MRKLIVNGDDLGMNEQCTRAIAQAFHEGLLTHTTMMANGACFVPAVVLAKEQGFLDKIGIHFNLTEGEPMTDGIRRLPNFVIDGKFCKRYLQNPRPLSHTEQGAVRRELSAQAEKLQKAGIPVTHADSHHYVHTIIYIAPLVAQVCKAYGIGRIRLSRTFDTPQRPIVTEDRIDNAYWREQGFVTTAHFGRLSDIVGNRVPDNTEIMVHPDYDRDGNLVDRIGMIDGVAIGENLRRLKSFCCDQ